MKPNNLGQEVDEPLEFRGFGAAQTTEYNLQSFAENGKAVLIFSDTRQNFSDAELRPLEDRSNLTGAARDVLTRLGVLDMLDSKSLNDVDIIYHRPENVTGDNPESFEKVHYYFDHNGLREDYRNSREVLSAAEVAEKVGPENFVEKRFAQEATNHQEVDAQPDYARANLSTQELNASPHLQNIADQHMTHNPHEYEPEI